MRDALVAVQALPAILAPGDTQHASPYFQSWRESPAGKHKRSPSLPGSGDRLVTPSRFVQRFPLNKHFHSGPRALPGPGDSRTKGRLSRRVLRQAFPWHKAPLFLAPHRAQSGNQSSSHGRGLASSDSSHAQVLGKGGGLHRSSTESLPGQVMTPAHNKASRCQGWQETPPRGVLRRDTEGGGTFLQRWGLDLWTHVCRTAESGYSAFRASSVSDLYPSSWLLMLFIL